jgi:tetratricopeptide (TPR) repeat protein
LRVSVHTPMNFLKKLFGGKSDGSKSSPAGLTTAATPSDPSKDPNMIRVHDAYGREMFITKQTWRDSVLLDHIKKVWDDPDALYSTIVQSLQDGFGADMVKPAERLAEIDRDAERGAVALAIVYREQKRLGDSEKVLRRQIERHGESGVVLTNLAKVQADLGEHAQVVKTLWRGLQIDPNQDNGLGWYEVIHREKDGPAAGLEALRRIAALPGAWRARLWLARDALERRDLTAALAFYQEAFAQAPNPSPTDMLQQVSGDLGNHGHLPEILSLVEPHFELSTHGLAVGNNLIKAHLDLGQLDAARALLDQLYALKRPDWQETLAFWDTEVAKARTTAAGAMMPAVTRTTTVVIDGPLWLRASHAAALLPLPKAAGSVVIACLGSSFSRADVSGGGNRLQMSDVPGRMSRALPIYLAEQLHLKTDAVGRVLQPWIQEGSGGFVLCGAPWSDAQAAAQARGGNEPADYVAVLHIDGTATPWTASLRFLRTIDGSLLGTAAAAVTPETSESAFNHLSAELQKMAVAHAQAHSSIAPDFYQVPTGGDFAAYQLRLEQELAVSFAATDGLTAGFLSGEREIVLGNLQLCLSHPHNVTTRLLLVQTLAHLKKVRPDIVAEFKDKIALLQKEKPLAEPRHTTVQASLDKIFGP